MKRYTFLAIFILCNVIASGQTKESPAGYTGDWVKGGEKTPGIVHFGVDDTLFLPDGSGVSYTSSFVLNGFPPNSTFTDTSILADIFVNMEHSFLGDLTMEIICPNFTTVMLENQGGVGTYLGIPIDDNMNLNPGVGWDYFWSFAPQYGIMSVEAANYPTLPSGSYKSYQPLSNLIGCPLNGIWTFKVTDNWSLDNGYIFCWGLDFYNDSIFATVSGKTYQDLNNNCLYDGNDYPLVNSIIEINPGAYTVMTDNNGDYYFYLIPGSYTISQHLNNSLWTQQCPLSNYSFTIAAITDTVTGLDFANQAISPCPDLSVDMSVQAIRPCFESTVFVQYANNGSSQAVAPYIDIALSPGATVTGVYGSFINYSVTGDTLQILLNDINPGQTGTLYYNISIACDVNLVGLTWCATAHIYPDSSCIPEDPAWDKSSVSVTGQCVADSLACFTITNTGDNPNGNMDGPSEYRIYENNMLMLTASFQLQGGESMYVCWPANGNTIRLEADQRPGHPGNSHPQDNVEMCGDSSANFVTGQILLVPPDDADDFIETSCIEITGSYDPNDISVIPAGITQDYYVNPNLEMEYTIRFQNTGNAEAYNVTIMDVIHNNLNISTLTPGISSHYYETCMQGRNVYFRFPGINLPDSTNNEPASHGFIKYKIKQNSGLPYGSVFTNNAGIVFDFNPSVITNTVLNTVMDINSVLVTAPVNYTDNITAEVFPNPASNEAYFKISGVSPPYKFSLYSVTGQMIYQTEELSENAFNISVKDFDPGIYFYNINNSNGLIATGKIVINK